MHHAVGMAMLHRLQQLQEQPSALRLAEPPRQSQLSSGITTKDVLAWMVSGSKSQPGSVVASSTNEHHAYGHT